MFYLIFLGSGVSGAIYEIAWVRQFGDVFGSTAYSTLLAVTVCLLGLGAGGYVYGDWSDGRHVGQPGTVLKTVGHIQLAVAGIGLFISILLPNLGIVSALTASYSRGATGWYSLSLFSSLVRGGIALILLSPGAFLFGGALILAIRYLTSRNGTSVTWRIALLCGAVLLGAALGAFLMDFTLAQTLGLRGAELVAVLLNVAAGLGALRLASGVEPTLTVPAPAVEPPATAVVAPPVPASAERTNRGRGKKGGRKGTRTVNSPSPGPPRLRLLWTPGPHALAFVSWAMALSGFAALGLVIVWFRQFTLVLGGFRAVYSLLLTTVLAGTSAGAFLAGLIVRYSSRPAHWLVGVVGLFVTVTLASLAMTDVQSVLIAASTLAQAPDGGMSLAGTWPELWLDLRPILIGVGLPTLLVGFMYPLAYSSVQRDEATIGRRAGLVHGAFALGAACSAAVTGLLLLPTLGIQSTVTTLVIAGGLAIVPLGFVARGRTREARTPLAVTLTLAGSTILAALAVGFWAVAPADFLIAQSMAGRDPNDQLLSLQEGVTAVVAVTGTAGNGQWLLTNGNPVSAGNRMSRRSTQALAHMPLLMSDRADSVLVIGFGVGHTAHAASLHPAVRRIDVVDPSSEVLAQAGYFKGANSNVLSDRRVAVYVNDGRQHLRMQPAGSYDVIALDPPPASLAGAGTLYSTEFYALARTRLKPKGYLSQQLSVYQVSPDTLLGMIRAFVDVFPQAVLLGGTGQELLLVGTNDSRLEIDPDRLSTALAAAPEAQADLQALSLSTARDIVGTFVASAQTLSGATRSAKATSDDRLAQEYAASSRLTAIHLGGVPASLVDLGQVAAWCPRCYADGVPVKAIGELGSYTALLEPLYKWSLPPADGPGSPADPQTQQIIHGSPYLTDLIEEHINRRNARGAALAANGRFDEAIEAFRNVLRLNPDSALTHWNLGRALASGGQVPASIAELRRSVELDPTQGAAHYDLASTLLDFDQIDAAIDEFRAAIRLMPKAVEAHNNLGIALGRKGRLQEAVAEFQEALKLNPDYAEAQHNLSSALQAAGSGAPSRGPR